MASVEKVIKKFKLSPLQVEEITQTAISMLMGDKLPSDNPIATVVGGQSGSGKTSLMNFTSIEFPNAIMIDNDTLRALHPKAKEIRKKYPEYYTQLTDQLGIGITSQIVDYFIGNNPTNSKYDIIFHQTLKNNRIADDAMTKFHNAGYLVAVRCLAVSYLESKMSQIERCKAQYETLGFCRHVSPDAHWDAITGIPYTLSYIEETGKYDILQIYARGKNIAQPLLMYSKINPQTEKIVKKTLKNRKISTTGNMPNSFKNANDAIKKVRQKDALRCAECLDKRLNIVIEEGGYKIPGMAEHIDELKEQLGIFKLENNITSPCNEK